VQLAATLESAEGQASLIVVEVLVLSADTVYPVIDPPPLFDGAVQLTFTNALPAVTELIDGALGTEIPTEVEVLYTATFGVALSKPTATHVEELTHFTPSSSPPPEESGATTAGVDHVQIPPVSLP
jgi:hypothetical protein